MFYLIHTFKQALDPKDVASDSVDGLVLRRYLNLPPHGPEMNQCMSKLDVKQLSCVLQVLWILLKKWSSASLITSAFMTCLY